MNFIQTVKALPGGDDPLTLDEVQREPGLLTAVKRAIDRDRRPGRFLLAGSASLLLMRQVMESLAGRATCLTLGPMTRREPLGVARAGRWDGLRTFRHEYGRKAGAGILRQTGRTAEWLTCDVLAVPWWRVR